jgi:hypothetical protein
MAIGFLITLLSRDAFGPTVVNAAQGDGPLQYVSADAIKFECTTDLPPNHIVCKRPQPTSHGQLLALGDVRIIDQKPIDSVCTPDQKVLYDPVTIELMPLPYSSLDVPTIPKIRAAIQRSGKVGNNTVFYHGDITMWEDQGFARQFSPPGAVLEHCIDRHDHMRWEMFYEQPWYEDYWKVVAQVLAEQSWGTIYVLFPQFTRSYDPRFSESKGPLFSRHTLAHLMTNPKIDRVMAVVYRSFYESPLDQTPKLLWKKGDFGIREVCSTDVRCSSSFGWSQCST